MTECSFSVCLTWMVAYYIYYTLHTTYIFKDVLICYFRTSCPRFNFFRIFIRHLYFSFLYPFSNFIPFPDFLSSPFYLSARPSFFYPFLPSSSLHWSSLGKYQIIPIHENNKANTNRYAVLQYWAHDSCPLGAQANAHTHASFIYWFV